MQASARLEQWRCSHWLGLPGLAQPYWGCESWARHLASPRLRSLICKMGTITPPVISEEIVVKAECEVLVLSDHLTAQRGKEKTLLCAEQWLQERCLFSICSLSWREAYLIKLLREARTVYRLLQPASSLPLPTELSIGDPHTLWDVGLQNVFSSGTEPLRGGVRNGGIR